MFDFQKCVTAFGFLRFLSSPLRVATDRSMQCVERLALKAHIKHLQLSHLKWGQATLQKSLPLSAYEK